MQGHEDVLVDGGRGGQDDHLAADGRGAVDHGIKTSILNSMLADAMYNKEPPSTKGKKLKIYYVSQVGTEPPLFVFSINDKDLMKLSYSRYLENRIRDTFEFIGSPIKFVFRDKEEGEK